MSMSLTVSDAAFTSGPAPYLAFAADDLTAQMLGRMAAQRGWPEALVLRGGLETAVAELSHRQTPRLLIVDLADSRTPSSDLAALSEVCDPGTRLIALGTVNDIRLYRNLIDMGVSDYLLKPLAPEALSEAAERALTDPVEAPQESPDGTARLVAVVGARGGVGATTVAVNAAWILAHEHQKRVALVDLDLYFGTTALALDLEPGRGFREALENPGRIDDLFIERAMVRESDRLYVLDSEEDLARVIRPDPSATDVLLARVRESFDIVVVDLPRGDLATTGVIEEADDIVLVSDRTLAGMRDSLRLHEFAKARAPHARIRVVANRVGLLGSGELSGRELEKGAEVAVDVNVPFDPKAVMEAANQGKSAPQVAPRSKVAAALRVLAGHLTGAAEESGPGPFWRRLIPRRKAG